MKYKHSLRFRITLSFFLFTTLLMVGVAIGVNHAIEDIEKRLMEESMQLEFNDFKHRYQTDPNHRLPDTASVMAYLVAPGQESSLPVLIRGLSAGIHEIETDVKTLQVFVGFIDDRKMVLVRDGTLFEQREENIFTAFLIAVFAASLLALWLGYGLSLKVIAPVTNLANSVANLTPDNPDTVSPASYADDEVGELARCFEHYLERLGEFVAREQEFTSNASHELRTPLTVIRGAVEILNGDPELTPRTRRVLQRIERAAESMSQMVETLLVLARENETRGEQVCQITDVVHECVDQARDLLGDKPVQLVTRLEQDFELSVAPSIVTILLGNLLRNAINCTSEGEITVSVLAGQVRVCDTGMGISQDDLPHIFERHFRGQREGEAGSGLGLAIVKRICDRYHWRIETESEAGKGTCFTLYF